MAIYFLRKSKEIKNDQNFIQSKYHIHTTPAFFQYFRPPGTGIFRISNL